MKTALSIALLCAICSCHQQPGLTPMEVTQAIQRFDNAWIGKKPAGVDSVLSPSYTYFTQSGGTFDRANILKTAGSAEYRLESFERKIIGMKIEGNTAVVNTIWIGKGDYYGSPFDDRQRCSVTLVKTGDEVKIMAEHCTVVK